MLFSLRTFNDLSRLCHAPPTCPAPRYGKSTNWTIRGTHLGTTIDRTAGTSQRKLAARVLTKLKLDIEAGR